MKKNNPSNTKAEEQQDAFKFIPVSRIINGKIMSKPTLLAAFKSGKLRQYKFGVRTFVDRKEFESLFIQSTVAPVEWLNKK